MPLNDWADFPAPLQPNDGETLKEWFARIAAYDTANPGVLKPLTAARLNTMYAELHDYADTALGAHTNRATGAHAASAIAYAPPSGLTSTTVQAALTELLGKVQTTTPVAPYTSAVTGTPNVIAYWRMVESSGTQMVDAFSTKHGVYLGAPSLGTPGPLVNDPPNTGVSFNGVSQAASVALDLSGTNAVTFAGFVNWSSYTNNNAMLAEFTPDYNVTAGGLVILPNSTDGLFEISMRAPAGARMAALFTRPALGWRHLGISLDRSKTTVALGAIKLYVDGIEHLPERVENTAQTGNFANSTLYLMARAGTTLFGTGGLSHWSSYTRVLTAAEHLALGNAAGIVLPPTPTNPSAAAGVNAGEISVSWA